MGRFKSTWQDLRSFGPIVHQDEGGDWIARCTWCVFRINMTCTYVKPARLMDTKDTPEWCDLREGMLSDAKEMAAERERQA